jgi:hypothetical protein
MRGARSTAALALACRALLAIIGESGREDMKEELVVGENKVVKGRTHCKN